VGVLSKQPVLLHLWLIRAAVQLVQEATHALPLFDPPEQDLPWHSRHPWLVQNVR
jgi:hypothetical protein